MIGDWVKPYGSYEGVYAKITSIEPNRINLLTTGGNPHNSTEDKIYGIPLTPEILEKNGFRNGDTLWYLEEDNFELEHNNNDSFIWIVGDVYIVAIIKYVHQLQQALRLSKIRKEIEL